MYQHITDHCFSDRLGGMGVARTEADAALAKLAPAFKALAARELEAATALFDTAARTDDLADIETLAAELRARFRHVVVAGTGGSGLNGKMLVGLKPLTVSPGFHFLENIDPDVMDALLSQLNVEQSCFLIISRSGATAETLSQFYVLLDHVTQRLGAAAARERFFAITLPGTNPLRSSAEALGIRVLDHEQRIGGRFSVLTNVGLFPAALAGLDIRALRRGAQTVIAQMDKAKTPADSYPALGAALQYAYIQKNYPITVMMPYSERLAGLSAWYRQSWAESLGKQGRGATAACAIGTTDQHSQLQLYLDGPKDKIIHLLTLKRAGKGRAVPAPDLPELAYFKHKTMGDVMAAEQRATIETLVAAHCPVRIFALDSLGEEEMGALVMHFTLEIILLAFLLDVNPFDQPAVEESKKLARDYLLKGDL